MQVSFDYPSDESNIVETVDVGMIELPYEKKVEIAHSSLTNLMKNGIPLVYAWSSGKDSSVALDIGLKAARDFKQSGGEVPPFVIIHGNTLLENPEIDRFAKEEIVKIEEFIKANKLPGQVEVATPAMSQNHMVNLIGGRTIASLPGTDSKCSVDMKVTPINSLKKKIFARLGVDVEPVSVIGTRFDESPQRMKKMLERGESDLEAIEHNGNLVISPIANFTLDDVFWHIGKVRNNVDRQSYSNFDRLVEVYKDGEGGNCMVLAYADEKPRSSGCGARFGCWSCNRVGTDRSMENMLKKDEYAYMRPLNAFRQWIRDTHFDPKRRNWLARSLDEDGSVAISPNAYSPQHCLTMLKIALTIQFDEEQIALSEGRDPRFEILSYQDVLAIDILWNRYGYNNALQATRVFRDVYRDGYRMEIPSIDKIYAALPAYTEIRVPYKDEKFDGVLSGLRDPDMAIIDQENIIEKEGVYYTDVLTDTKMGIDEEGAEMFFGFPELGIDYFLDRTEYSYPAAGLHALARLGVFSIANGRHRELDRMLRMGNQLSRYNLKEVLHDREKLIERILEKQGLDYQAVHSVRESEHTVSDLFDMQAGAEEIAETTEYQYQVLREIEKISIEKDRKATIYRINDNLSLRRGLFGEAFIGDKTHWFAISPKGKFQQLSSSQVTELSLALIASNEVETVFSSSDVLDKERVNEQGLSMAF
ncbi:MAG: hypothetical protein CL693_00920 [Cellvibrionaceae bacterium]|nr:hypothetical protein [Cellvibrionaceae bacterium]